jgi:methyl coenzyme M reductase subunit D
MSRDKKLLKLVETWNKLEDSLVARTPIEGPAMVESNDKLIQPFKDLLTIQDDEVELSVKLGWVTLGTVNEDEGKWYPTIGNRELLSLGYNTKEEALQKILDYYKND